ncbi:MAG: SMP-30/gluconolactonase/LRE family protein [Candidatus Solibacter sp.]|nr:SMP-30/gluconolactonase/LRE family protein [Candidatus Solibacter sp.]
MKIRGRSFLVCLGLLCHSAAHGQQYTIKTLAGNGSAAFVDGDLSAAQLNSPGAVALDSKGTLYIADTGNHCIRTISGSNISTFAGTCGTIGYSGDKAAATAAKLNAPAGLAFDSKDNLYIADTGNSVIRKITGSTITTVAGDYGRALPYGGDGGLATAAFLDGPTAAVLDSAGNLYIADTGNSLIRKVDDKTQIITSYLGSGVTDKRLDHPNGLWFDASGALYIADSNHQSVAKYVALTLSTIANRFQEALFSGDGGPAITARLNKPVGVTIDAAGSVYIADTNNSRIRKITPDGIITTIAGSKFTGYNGDGGSATDAWLNFPRSIAVRSDGTVYIADTNNHVIRVLTPTFPTINSNGVTNAASFAARISPGALASIFGTGFGTATYQADDGFAWPTTANFVSVKVNGVAAPLYYVSPGQINFQVPWATPTTGTVNVAVLFNGGSSNIVAVPVATAAPGLFYLPHGAAIVQNTPSYSLNEASNPAPAGSTIIAYLTGSGPVSPTAKDGAPTRTDTLTSATSAVTAKIGSTLATVSFTGLTPGFIGLVQMNIVVPPLAAGVYPLPITVDGQTASSATIAGK